MADLQGISLAVHLDHLFSKKARKYLYSLPTRKFFKGFKDVDLSVNVFGKKAATPLGPAAGPHTQLAQNILMSFLAGGRIMELKTIQILDNLDIERPCIDIRNIGYNIEWSQELTLHNSYQEYLNAWIMLHILSSQDFLKAGHTDSFYNFVFDMSVGYNLAGIQSDQVSGWIRKMNDAGEFIGKELDQLPSRYRHFKSLKIPPRISESITLSTFHGCPAGEIEKIVKFLISEHDLNVVVKMNPTLLGYDFVENILHSELGYYNIELDKDAFDSDLKLPDAISMMRRLDRFAKAHGRCVGAKFTNTLVVKNNESVFKDSIRYLSGSPLYVIAMHSMHEFRTRLDCSIPVSFSGGIDRDNFAEAVSCNLNPVTTCTDILKKGGYSRIGGYLDNLRAEMLKIGARDIPQYILKKADTAEMEQLEIAGRKNTVNVIQQLIPSNLYHFDNHKNIPAKTDSELGRFDCLNCDICIPVCPNGANFYYRSVPGKYTAPNYSIDSMGKVKSEGNFEYSVVKEEQIGNIAEFCNDCGNCETFCPEQGAPYLEKLRFFLTQPGFDRSANRDGVFIKSISEIYYRKNQIIYQLNQKATGRLEWLSGHFNLTMSTNGEILEINWNDTTQHPCFVDGSVFILMKSLLEWYQTYPDSFPAEISDQKSAFFP